MMLEMFFYGMGLVFGVSLLAKAVSTFTVRRMVKEASEIQKSNHKLMKLLKAKFEHASMVSNRVQNVGAFVDKYLYEYKVCGIRLDTWRELSKRGVFLMLLLGIVSVFETVRLEGMSDGTVEYIQWTGIFVLLLLAVQFLSGEKVRLLAARNYMVEYLENVCVHRYSKKYQVAEENEEEVTGQQEVQEKIEVQEMQKEEKEEPKVQILEKMSEEERKSQQEMRIRAILEEFLA